MAGRSAGPGRADLTSCRGRADHRGRPVRREKSPRRSLRLRRSAGRPRRVGGKGSGCGSRRRRITGCGRIGRSPGRTAVPPPEAGAEALQGAAHGGPAHPGTGLGGEPLDAGVERREALVAEQASEHLDPLLVDQRPRPARSGLRRTPPFVPRLRQPVVDRRDPDPEPARHRRRTFPPRLRRVNHAFPQILRVGLRHLRYHPCDQASTSYRSQQSGDQEVPRSGRFYTD
jgi:hypothetical protein